MNYHYIINIIIIILIFVVVFSSQQPRFDNVGRGLYLKTLSIIRTIWEKIENIFDRYILSRLLGEAEKRKENVEGELEAKKENIKREITTAFYDLIGRIKNFFKVIFYSIF